MRDPKIRKFFESIGYPKEWIEEGQKYSPEDSYVAFDPEWALEPIPPLPKKPIFDILLQRKDSNKTALVCLGKEVSYKELNDMSDRLANALVSMGIKKGDRVATLLPNCIQHTIAFFAINKIGAICVPNNVMYTPRELEYQLKDSGAKILITLDSLYPVFEKVSESHVEKVILTNIKDFAAKDAKVPNLFDVEEKEFPNTYSFLDLLREYTPLNDYATIDPENDLCLMIYTSGTTGRPKGVMSTHKNLWANIWIIKHAFGVGEKDVDMQIMPTFHCSGWDLAQLPTLYAGGTVVLVPLFNPEECLELIQRYKINIIFAPPTFFIGLMNYQGFKNYDLSSLRIPLSCGAPLPPAVKEMWDKLTGIYLYDGYGLTETNCGGVACLSFPKKKKAGCVGTVTLGEMKIVDENGEVVPRGVVGEIMFRGFGVAKGYWNMPEETKKTFREDGWLHTGDAGYLDEENFLHFVDRYKDLIIASGYNIAPYEIESIIMQHPAVKEAAVVGVPDEYRGETVKAFVSLKDEYKGKASESDIIEFCKQYLAKFKVPREVEFMDEIPKNPVGKILRRELREREIQKRGKG